MKNLEKEIQFKQKEIEKRPWWGERGRDRQINGAKSWFLGKKFVKLLEIAIEKKTHHHYQE